MPPCKLPPSSMSGPDLGTVLVAGGWTRDAGPPGVVRLTTVTDLVAIGTATPNAGRKLTVYEDASGNLGIDVFATDRDFVTYESWKIGDAFPRIRMNPGRIRFSDGTYAPDGTIKEGGEGAVSVEALTGSGRLSTVGSIRAGGLAVATTPNAGGNVVVNGLTTVVFTDTSGGDTVITLPDATLPWAAATEATWGVERVIIVKKTSILNQCQIISVAGNVEGNAPGVGVTIPAGALTSYTFVSDGTDWWIV